MDLSTIGMLLRHYKLNGHNGIYNSDIGFKQTRKAYAELLSGTTKIYNIVVLGDSLAEGGLSDALDGKNWVTKGWAGILRKALSDKFQDLGMGFIPPHFPHYQSWWVYGEGWYLTQNYGYNWGVGKSYASGEGGLTGILTVPFTGTKCKIVCASGSITGKYTYKIDSGSTTQIDTGIGGDEYGLKETTTGTVSQGTHTLTITKVADGKDVILFGILPINANTKGFRLNCNARWGTFVDDFVDEYSGDYPGIGGNFYNEGIEITYWSPVLTIIALIANDAWSGTPIDDYKRKMQQLISIAKLDGDVWLINDSGSDNTLATHSDTLPYENALLDLAIQNGCAYSDVSSFLGESGTLYDYGVEAEDGTHLNAIGHRILGTRIVNQLLQSIS